MSSNRARKYSLFLKALFSGQIRRGFCCICGERSLFVPLGSWYREDLKCIKCKSSSRQRAIIDYVCRKFPDLYLLNVYEPAPTGPGSRYLSIASGAYACSHYFPDLELGATVNGFKNEDLQALTYEDESFDLVISQDVFEHIADPLKAFEEIGRILRPGGSHVFTIPWYPDRRTRSRAALIEGEIVYYKEAEYHGNPVDDAGSLVYTCFGYDLNDLIQDASAMSTAISEMQDRNLGIEGHSVNIFHSRKPKS